jgi:hypothetical protein
MYGEDGENLKKYFIDELDKCFEEVFNNDKFKDILKDDKNKKFNIIVMNAIQFQCSLGFKPSKEKNELCKKLFKDEVKDEVKDKNDKSEKNIIKSNMIKRLSVYKPKCIVNCSTYKIRKK